MRKQYVITSPPFEVTSGGVRVLYGLYGWLLAKGEIAFINQRLPGVPTVAIYPEIQIGNPANASTVVRYILNKPGVVDAIYTDGSVKKGPTEFAPTDRLYYFSRLFGDTDPDHYLFLPILNLHLFKDYKRTRTKTAYFIGKGIKDPKLPDKFIHPQDAILIDRDFAQDQQALVDLLNECEVLYCYDPVTAMTEVARLCGCRIVMVNPIYSKDEFSAYEPGMNGISWGKDTGERLQAEDFRRRYLDLREEFERKFDLFIEDTQR